MACVVAGLVLLSSLALGAVVAWLSGAALAVTALFVLLGFLETLGE